MDSKEQKILEVAFRLFHQHGYRKVTMSDIAEAAGMSRPSLYAAFANKEAVFMAIAVAQGESCDRETKQKLPLARTLEEKLALLFEIWIVTPFASVVDSPSGLDLLTNAANYVPACVELIYPRFEQHLYAVLKPEMAKKRSLSARDLAHILMLATKGLKVTTSTLAELRRLTDGLITMAIATTRA